MFEPHDFPPYLDRPGRELLPPPAASTSAGLRSLTEDQSVEFTFHPTRQDSFDFIADRVWPADR